jgi:hypothetical protein
VVAATAGSHGGLLQKFESYFRFVRAVNDDGQRSAMAFAAGAVILDPHFGDGAVAAILLSL